MDGSRYLFFSSTGLPFDQDCRIRVGNLADQFENIDHASDWFDAAPIAEIDRQKIGRDNARALFKLD